MESTEIFKVIQIIFILSPFFFSIFFLAVLIRKGVKYLKRFAWFWLISSIVLTIFVIYAIYTERNGLAIHNGLAAASAAWANYETRKSKKNKKKPK